MFSYPLAGVAALALALPLGAQVADNFADYSVGGTLATPLNAGIGWGGAWTGVNGTATGVVADSSPLGTGGNYLDVSLARGSGGGVSSLYRDMGASSLGLRSDTHTISFSWRADNLTSFTHSTGGLNDRFEFFNGHNTGVAGEDTSGLVSANNGDSNANGLTNWSTYLIGVFSASRGINSTARAFTVYDPDVGADGEVFDGADYFNIGSGGTSNSGGSLIVTAGTTYNLAITVHPSTKTYDVTVSDGTTTVFTNGVKFWGNPSATGQYLVFATRGDQSGELREFSIDNVAVVPEPSTLALLIGAVAGAFVVIQRRRQRA